MIILYLLFWNVENKVGDSKIQMNVIWYKLLYLSLLLVTSEIFFLFYIYTYYWSYWLKKYSSHCNIHFIPFNGHTNLDIGPMLWFWSQWKYQTW